MKAVIKKRKEDFKEEMDRNPAALPKDIYQKMEAVYCLIDDVDDFVEFTKEKEPEISDLVKDAAAAGINLVITAHTAKLKGIAGVVKFTKTATEGLVLSDQGMGPIFPLGMSVKDQPQFMDGCLFHNGTYERLRIPKYE